MSSVARELVLTGPMGAGKSSVGRLVARWLGARFDDLDELVEAREGISIQRLFERGEERFRRAETRALHAWMADSAIETRVLALGGGSLVEPGLAEAVSARATLVHLDAPAEGLLARLTPQARAARPLLTSAVDPLARLEQIRCERVAGYEEALLRIDTAVRDLPGVALELLRRLYASGGPWEAHSEMLSGERFASGSVSFGRGGLPFPPSARATLLWDSTLPAVHRDLLIPELRALAGGQLLCLERIGGEDAKTPESLVGAWEELLAAGVDKDVPLWVTGGGTLMDLGGLLAQTFKRGLDCALLPTTLLAQVDAGLGGKNGINLAGAKNVVGTIRLPQQVHLDVLFLLSLAEDDLRCGLSEAIKSALIADPKLIDLIESRADDLFMRSLPLLEEVTRRAARVKLRIIARDLDESGERRQLNLGHTLGHALETLRGRRGRPLRHGDAVATGLVFAARLARSRGELEEPDLVERLEELLARLGLPVALPHLAGDERQELLDLLRHDKKRRGGENLWVLPHRAGTVRVQAVPPEEVAAELAVW